MASKYDPNLMRKEYVYALFIIKFLLGLALIYWTIATTMSSDVGTDDDNAFLSTYKDVDFNFNKIHQSNQEFSKKYNIKFDFNGYEIVGLSIEDVFLAQRAIQARETRKDMLQIGQNNFAVYIQDKQGNEINSKDVKILISRATNNEQNINLKLSNEDTTSFQLDALGGWNITGTVEVGEDIGYFYIKTNAKR
jgi:hypothetical protein